jgi:2-C-methyl-D-erythritol 4-phosphate cytidylyltransferase / 2-C-methyl-D-erythritol 2,4-cyclodiphosphate synthase
MGFSALIVAAGSGERAGGGLPKQYRAIAGKPLLRWTAEAFTRHPGCEEIVIAIHPDHRAHFESAMAGLNVRAVEGGADRTASVRACLNAANFEHVLIHDGARPLVGEALIDRLLSALQTSSGAAPALPVTDALVRQDGDGVKAVDRAGLQRMQTPQAFIADAIRAAFEATDGAFPDEVSLARAAGLEVALVAGEEANIKITWPDDFARAERLLAPATSPALTVAGTGYDVHRVRPGKGLTLCGVFIDHPLELVGHSDADVGLHALTDAILGAAGAGDIGQHFPPTDPQWKGADSAQFLVHALKLAREAGVEPIHADITLICEAPKIGPHREAMKRRVAELTGLPPVRVNIKATTSEKLGFTGRGEGIAAQAAFTGRIS